MELTKEMREFTLTVHDCRFYDGVCAGCNAPCITVDMEETRRMLAEDFANEHRCIFSPEVGGFAGCPFCAYDYDVNCWVPYYECPNNDEMSQVWAKLTAIARYRVHSVFCTKEH